ncbi:MAG: PKD domain-containing protein [Deltaproteobacteria bacterium]|nr:PKD domain-containing protein [Deltaproteobacteria bacterium]
MIGATRLLLAAALLPLVGACPRPIDELPVNLPPTARLVWPQLWPAGEPALFDPTFSEDAEGGPLRYRMTYGDGTPDAEGAGTLEHVYQAPASYGVELTVTDEQGLDARVQGQIVVVGDDLEPCSCALPCLDDAVCAAELCLLFVSALEDDEAPVLDDQLECP